MPPIYAIDARLIGGTSTGDSTYWTGLLHGLRGIKPSAKILLISNAPKPSGIPLAEGFEWICVQARSSRWWSLVSFPAAARRAGASAMHTQYSLSPLTGKIGVTTIHDVSFFIGPAWFRPKDRHLLRVIVPSAVRRAAAVISVSETSRSELIQYVPGAKPKAFVTQLACPPWIQAADPHEAQARVSKLYGLDKPYLLTVSTRWPRKNMDLAVKAASLLSDDLPHRLVLTGKHGWGEETLGKRGFATGYVDEPTLCDLYSAASLYLAPSRHEGFGFPVLEAFRCGCPVLCSAGGALPETAGDAGAIESSWEPSDWARRIESLLKDESTLEVLRSRGTEREKLFSWERTARETIEVYRRVAR